MKDLNFVLATTVVGAGIGGYLQWQGSQRIKGNIDPDTGIKIANMNVPYILVGAGVGLVSGVVLGLGWGALKEMGHFAHHHPFIAAAGGTVVVIAGLAALFLFSNE